jgi:hypothetical protein
VARVIRTLALFSAVLSLGLSGAEDAGAAWLYPTSPFALRAAPTVLGLWPLAVSRGTHLEWMWVGREGEALVLSLGADGSLVSERVISLPAGARPISVIGTGVGVFVLDAAHDRLLVFSNESSTVPVVSLPVGPGASALAVSPSASGATIAVANAGSADVSIFTAGPGPVVGPERRVAVGATPVALAFADLTFDGIPELAVADAGSGSISVLAGDDTQHLALRSSVPVGGAPSALAVANLNDRRVPDLLVGDAAAPRVAQVLWSGKVPSVGPDIPLPDTASRGSTLVVGSFDRDDYPDLAVADRGTATVWMAHGNPNGSFGPMALVRAGVDAAGVDGGQFGGDFQADLAVADARTQTVMLLLTPGDRFLSPRSGATHLAARLGELAWSQARGARDYRLELWNGEAASDVPITPSTRELAPHIGRRTPQRPVVSYVRCREGSCRPFEWDIARHRERPFRIATAPGCGIDDVAVWDDTLAYLVRADQSRCAARARGLWLRHSSQRPRRLAAHATIGALQSGQLVWKDFQPSHNTARLRLLAAGGHARTLDRENIENALSVPTLDGHYVYWTRGTSELDFGRPPLIRQTTGARACRQGWPYPSFSPEVGLHTRELESTGDFAVDHGQLFYADDSGVFQVDPSRVHWTRACAGA